MAAECSEPVRGSVREFETAIIGNDIREECVRLAHGVARIYLERHKASSAASELAPWATSATGRFRISGTAKSIKRFATV